MHGNIPRTARAPVAQLLHWSSVRSSLSRNSTDSVLVTRHSFLAATLLALVAPSLAAQADSTPRPLFRQRDAALTALFLGGSAALSLADSKIAHSFHADPGVDAGCRFTGIANAVSCIDEKSLFGAGVLTYAVGRIAGGPNSTVADIGAHVSEAVLISTVLNTVVRGIGGRSRPMVTNGDDPYDFHPFKGFSNFDYRAFPSVHASSSFATAAVITAETRRRHPSAAPWVGILSYGIAAMPGVGRVYLRKHWASDVLMGAFVGTLTGLKVEEFEHTRRNTWVRRVFLR